MLEALKGRLRAPYAALLALLTRWSPSRVGVALVYHRIGQIAQDGEHHLVPTFSSALFEQQVRHLRARYRLVPGSALLAAVRSRRRGERIPVAITFDDDLPAHLQVAAPILRRRQAPATFFLMGAYLRGPRTFWWEALQLAHDRGLLAGGDVLGIWPPATPAPEGKRIHDFELAVQQMPRPEREALTQRILELVGPRPESKGIGAQEIEALAREGFEIGFHTRDHDQLTGLSDDQLDAALTDGRRELEELADAELTTIAYPHGVADPRVTAAARAAGFRWGFTVRPEPVGEHTEPLLMGRLEPARESVGRFALEVARALRAGPEG